MPSAPKRGSPGGLRTPQQARSRRTRKRILEAASGVFEEKGYDETTTAAIARRAHVAVGSVYGYFPDKRAILLEILHETVEAIADRIVGGLEPELWRDADAGASVRSLIEIAFKTRDLRPGLQRILWERFFKDPEVRAATEAIERRVRGAIERLLTTLKSEGRSRLDDASSAAFVIHTSVEWVAARLVLGGAPEDVVDAAVETTTDMISRLILAD